MGWNKAARNFVFAPDSNWTLIWHLLLVGFLWGGDAKHFFFCSVTIWLLEIVQFCDGITLQFFQLQFCILLANPSWPWHSLFIQFFSQEAFWMSKTVLCWKTYWYGIWRVTLTLTPWPLTMSDRWVWYLSRRCLIWAWLPQQWQRCSPPPHCNQLLNIAEFGLFVFSKYVDFWLDGWTLWEAPLKILSPLFDLIDQR